jgi:hypothetical protein
MPAWAFVVLTLALIGAATRATAQDVSKGREEYLRSCAECHGGDGGGHGAMASKLKVKLADLRTIAKRNRGVYPSDSVYETIDGRRVGNRHAKSGAPVWGCRQSAPSGSRGTGSRATKSSSGFRGAMRGLLERERYSKTSRKARKKHRSKRVQAEAVLDMPCESETVIHDRMQSIVEYLRTIQVK